MNATMIVDSGADFSIISLKAGQDLGYALADGEHISICQTIGGTVEYVLRQIEMTIDGYNLMVPTAWIQNNTADVMLLGREVVFDKFNIEFRQADEEIIFIPILKKNTTILLSPPLSKGGLGGVKDCCTILEKWYYQT